MARPKGFEPLTPRFVVWCSIQLSYGRVGGDISPPSVLCKGRFMTILQIRSKNSLLAGKPDAEFGALGI